MKSYDPGMAGEIIPEGDGKYLVESFRDRGEYYSVDIFARTCTCLDHLIRGRECKHIQTVEDRRNRMAVFIAAGMDGKEIYERCFLQPVLFASLDE